MTEIEACVCANHDAPVCGLWIWAASVQHGARQLLSLAKGLCECQAAGGITEAPHGAAGTMLPCWFGAGVLLAATAPAWLLHA